MRPSVSAIVKVVCEDAGLEPAVIASGRRKRPIARARHRAEYLAEGLRRDLSLGVITRLLGIHHHASLLNGAARVKARLADGDPEERGAIERCLRTLGADPVPTLPRGAFEEARRP